MFKVGSLAARSTPREGIPLITLSPTIPEVEMLCAELLVQCIMSTANVRAYHSIESEVRSATSTSRPNVRVSFAFLLLEVSKLPLVTVLAKRVN